jgi:serine/threonine-protein kinase
LDQKDLEAARSLERRGRLKTASQAYEKAGAPEEAARLLAQIGRPEEASRVLLKALRVDPRRVGKLPPEKRKLAFKAAIYASKGADKELAVDLFQALGERARAAQLLEQSGDGVAAARIRTRRQSRAAAPEAGGETSEKRPTSRPSSGAVRRLEAAGQLDMALQMHLERGHLADAAQVARQMGRMKDAAELFLEAGRAYEAAECYREHKDPARALESLTRVPQTDERYRRAAREAVSVARELATVNVRMESFLSSYISSGPQNDEELESFYLLGQLYAGKDFPENAEEVYKKILEQDPRYRDVPQRLEALRAETHRVDASLAGILKEDSKFWRDPLRTELPDKTAALPGLPWESPPAAVPPGEQAPAAGGAGPAAAAPGPPGGATVEELFAVGATIADRYRIEQEVGRGGMATVYRAADLELGEDVALKVFRQVADDAAMARFRQELRLSRRLIHHNIARLYDIGVHHGFRYISMELLQGESLEERIRRQVPLDKGVSFFRQACEALGAAHEQGVIHRDVKPANMFIVQGETLKIMDFGIAKQRQAPGLTTDGAVIGTPEYMSPEQIRGFSSVTEATDLYALGVIAYEMFTGSLPFNHDELVPLLMMQLQENPEPPRARNQQLPGELEAIILKLMEKDPNQRFRSCRELADALKALPSA